MRKKEASSLAKSPLVLKRERLMTLDQADLKRVGGGNCEMPTRVHTCTDN
jgi:hypothetical protein